MEQQQKEQWKQEKRTKEMLKKKRERERENVFSPFYMKHIGILFT